MPYHNFFQSEYLSYFENMLMYFIWYKVKMSI